MVAGTLYTYPESTRAVKVRVAAAYGGSELKVVEVSSGDKSHAQVPFFESSDKKVQLMDANAIAYYLANDQLRGSSTVQQAQVLQWVNYGSTDVYSAVASWVFPALSLVETTPQNLQRAKEDLKRVFSYLNEQLKTRTFLVGERLTLADVALAADLLLAYQHVADEKFRKAFSNTNRWFTTVVNQTNFRKVAGEVKLADRCAEFNADAYAKNKKEIQAANKPAKQEKPKPEPKKAEPKKKEKEVEEEDDLAVREEPKNDPFAAMPKGTFVMDEFKREYSNKDTLTVAIPYFWNNFDKECYSIWYCEYKYPEELTLTFMSSNLVGGMFQRIEKLRKNAFASMIVYGENNNNQIAGVWVWKGHELVFPLCQDWTTDYESYTWKKLNPADENDRKLVNQFLLWEGDLNGKKFSDGKIFK